MNLLDKYPEQQSADAYLDLVVSNYGYVAAGIGRSTPYRPQFTLRVRLVRAKDSAVLMQDTVVYNLVQPSPIDAKKAITISANPAYEFATFDTLEMNGATAVKGLEDATLQTADAVTNLLK